MLVRCLKITADTKNLPVKFNFGCLLTSFCMRRQISFLFNGISGEQIDQINAYSRVVCRFFTRRYDAKKFVFQKGGVFFLLQYFAKSFEKQLI